MQNRESTENKTKFIFLVKEIPLATDTEGSEKKKNNDRRKKVSKCKSESARETRK